MWNNRDMRHNNKYSVLFSFFAKNEPFSLLQLCHDHSEAILLAYILVHMGGKTILQYSLPETEMVNIKRIVKRFGNGGYNYYIN